jgi:hypothetical protein
MTTQNAIKALAKYGVVENYDHNLYRTRIGNYLVSFVDQDGRAGCFQTQRVGEVSDIRSDYFPGSYWNSLKSAISYADRKYA